MEEEGTRGEERGEKRQNDLCPRAPETFTRV